MKLKGAQVLLECIKEQGVNTIFGYPGGAVLPIYDALYNTKGITHVLTAHEQGATHAADGYARSTGKVGVVIATSGPGATNTVTGIATAYRDSVPLVVFTGQVPMNLLGKDSFQEVDIKDITDSITKGSYIVEDPLKLVETIRMAFEIARKGRPGPVVVDIPKNIQVALVEYESEQINKGASYREQNFCSINEEEIEKVINMIENSSTPVIYSGGGVIISDASEELRKFVERVDAPITSSLMGMGAFRGDHPNYMGMVGMHGSRCSNYAVTSCDLLIAIGARFSDRVISKVEAFAPSAKIIHIDIDPREFGKNINIDLAVKGDVKLVLQAINKKLRKQYHGEWLNKVIDLKKENLSYEADNKKLSPKYIIEKLWELTKGECIITTEVGQNQIWAAQYFKYLRPRQFISSGGLGTMGFGLGAAIGAAIGNPDTKVINIAGDGSFKMNSTELATVYKYNVPMVQLVLNNNALGMVHQWQDLFYDGRFSCTKLTQDVDFIKLGEAYGIKTFKITKNSEVEEVLRKSLQLKEPVLIECEINREEKVFPIVPPGAALTEVIG